MRRYLGVLSLAAIAAAAGCNRNDIAENTAVADTPVATSDAEMRDAAMDRNEFVAKAAEANKVEIETSTLAETQAQRPEVKELAAMITSDHTAAADALANAAGPSAGLATVADDDPDVMAKVNDLKASDADSFDRDYLDMMEEGHERAIALFEDYDQDGTNPNLDSFVAQTLPTLREHLTKVREIRQGFDVGDDAMGLGSGDDQPDATTTPDAATDETMPQPQ